MPAADAPVDGSGSAAPESGRDAARALEERYGTARRGRIDRRLGWGIAGALVVAGIGFLFFSEWETANRVDFQDIGYAEAGENSVDFTFDVSGPAPSEVACAVEVLNTSKGTVGWKVVEIPVTDTGTQRVTTNVVLTGAPTAATVRSCWVVERAAA